MRLLESLKTLILEATEYVRKFTLPKGVLKLYTQEHQEEITLQGFGSQESEKELKRVFEKGVRRRIPSSVIAQSVAKHKNKIFENGEGILRGCEYKNCRILFIDRYKGVGQIEYILQFYKNNRIENGINAVIITSAASKEGDDFLKSLKTLTPKVRLSESQMCEDVVYL